MTEKWIKQITARLTPEEKASLISGRDQWHTQEIKRLKIDSVTMCDGPHGLRPEKTDAGKKYTAKATCFPTASALACTWNTDILYKVGQSIAQEAREEKVSLLLGPGMNIKRSPLCGRNFEYYSEDPLLTGRLAAAFISGVQSQGVGACVKHFALNNCECMRMVSNSAADERTMREIYLKGFEIAVKEAQPWAVMTAYNKVNGTYASENTHLLRDILRGEWGFDGLTLTDWGAVNDIAKALNAGLDLEMPSSRGQNPRRAADAVKNGTLNGEILDEAVEHVLTLVGKAVKASHRHYLLSYEANHRIARKAAEEAIVLLKNENDILPLKKEENLAVIGYFAAHPRMQGTGSSQVNAAVNGICCLNILKQTYPSLIYAQGFTPDGSSESRLFQQACEAAEKARKVILFIGLTDEEESEGRDRNDMKLPAAQLRLAEKICTLNKNTVLVLSNGAPIELPFAERAEGILAAHLAGEGGAEAICRILTGKVNPSGKLAETYPISLSDTPAYKYFPRGKERLAEYREGIYVGYRYYDKSGKNVLFPFGHGLSYTEFTYDNLKVKKENGTVNISFRLKNSGKCFGRETVQLYIRDAAPVIYKADKELKGFYKSALNTGESEEIAFTLTTADFAFYDADEKRFRTSAGEYEIIIGASSRDIRLQAALTLTNADGAETAEPFHTAVELPSYYNTDQKTLRIPHLEYERVLGEKPCDDNADTPGHYGWETVLGTLRDIPAATKFLGDYADMPDDIPLKTVAAVGGVIDYAAADALIGVLNGDGDEKALKKQYRARRRALK